MQKNEGNLWTRSLNFLQNVPSNSVPFSSLFICVTVSNASWRVEFWENIGNIWKIKIRVVFHTLHL